jgi:hypothetical protein
VSGVRIICSHGRYNICDPSQREWLLELLTPYGRVSALFDEEPGTPPECVESTLDAIEARIRSYLYISSREQSLATIAAIRAHLPECELATREAKAEKLRRQISDAETELARCLATATMLRAEIAERAVEATQ